MYMYEANTSKSVASLTISDSEVESAVSETVLHQLHSFRLNTVISLSQSLLNDPQPHTQEWSKQFKSLQVSCQLLKCVYNKLFCCEVGRIPGRAESVFGSPVLSRAIKKFTKITNKQGNSEIQKSINQAEKNRTKKATDKVRKDEEHIVHIKLSKDSILLLKNIVVFNLYRFGWPLNILTM